MKKILNLFLVLLLFLGANCVNAEEEFAASSNEQIAKLTESFNNTAFATAIRILDSVIAELFLTIWKKQKAF